jgi:lysylphosphatidylglycerol synthetase-like protein (DUF2156 family)
MDVDDQGSSRIRELRGSARGWQGAQLAVLGFIGLCGVLQRNAGSGKPDWLQVLAGLLALGAFAIACLATVLVALAAWPVYAPHAGLGAEDEEAELASTSRRLRTGITLTYAAVAVLALAASSSWWPVGASGQGQSAVQVATQGGQLCGSLTTPSGPGTLALSTGGRRVEAC